MEIILIIFGVLALYFIIQVAIDRSISTQLLKENLEVLVEIKALLKEMKE